MADDDKHLVRPADERPAPSRVLWRSALVVVFAALTLWLFAAILPGFDIDNPAHALLAGLVVGVVNAVVWPALASIVVPLSVLTLGIGAIVLDALLVGLVLDALPGVTLNDFGTALVIAIGLALMTTIVSSLLAADDDGWFDDQAARRARRRQKAAMVTDVPGVVFIQLDGVARRVLERAMSSGDAPTLRRWVEDGAHTLTSWTTGWSSQTGVSQCGILHGSTRDMPAFRWVDKQTGEVVVSNRPKSAAAIELAHSDGRGLLFDNGSSYGNLFSGDAERAVLTMSGITKRKEGRIGAGYGGYFSRAQQTARTFIGVVTEVARERHAATLQRRRQVEPRVERSWLYAFMRAFTTVVSRDVCVQGVVNDMCEGRTTIYVDLLGYDEVAHHSGPERADTLAVLRDLDRQVGRIERLAANTARPYRIVVLSDHGQTQGATFAHRAGETLTQLVGRLCGRAAESGDQDAEEGRTESSAWLRRNKPVQPDTPHLDDQPIVLGSGALGLIYLPGDAHRLTREEIDARYPQLIPGLAQHPAIGFVLVRTAAGTSVVLGAHGSLDLASGEVTGDDPLAPFGPAARVQVTEVDAYTTTADLMVNSLYDPEFDEVAAFEDQVGSHGALGGPQTHPFILHPTDLPAPDEPIVGSPAVHRVLKGWLGQLGQQV